MKSRVVLPVRIIARPSAPPFLDQHIRWPRACLRSSNRDRPAADQAACVIQHRHAFAAMRCPMRLQTRFDPLRLKSPSQPVANAPFVQTRYRGQPGQAPHPSSPLGQARRAGSRRRCAKPREFGPASRAGPAARPSPTRPPRPRFRFPRRPSCSTIHRTR